MLDGTTNAQDARLIADINAADPFDGMTQADTQTTQASDPLMDRIEGLVRDAHNRAWKLGQMQGLNDAAGIVLQAGHIEAANVLIAKFDEMND